MRAREGWVSGQVDDQDGTLDPSEEVLSRAHELLTGVQQHREEIDLLIEEHAERWELNRMPVVDRNLLRIALFELLWCDDVPVAVAINEAVELAKSLSTEDSGRFVNGLLGRIAQERDPS